MLSFILIFSIYGLSFHKIYTELDQVRKKLKNYLSFLSAFFNYIVDIFRFYTKTRFPGVIGCIDCTRVAIVPPSSNLNLIETQHPEYIYVNRKCHHSINV